MYCLFFTLSSVHEQLGCFSVFCQEISQAKCWVTVRTGWRAAWSLLAALASGCVPSLHSRSLKGPLSFSAFFLLCFTCVCAESLQFSSVQSLSRVQLFATQWTVACQAPLSVAFPRQEYWSGLPLEIPPQGSNLSLLCLLHWQAGSLPLVEFIPFTWLMFLSGTFCTGCSRDKEKEKAKGGGGKQRFRASIWSPSALPPLCEAGSPHCFVRLLWGHEEFSHVLRRVTLKCRRPLVCPVVVLTVELVFRGTGFSGGCLWCIFTRCFFTVHPRTGRCDFGARNPRDTVLCKDWVNLRVGWPWPKVSLSVCIKSPRAGWSGTRLLRWCGHSPSVDGTFCFCALVMGYAGVEKQASLPSSGH